jgi:hypothetical protein
MGVVYKARHAGLNRLVALKMILSGDLAGPEACNRFRREAEAVARLAHPNIIQIYDIGQHDNRLYLSFEYAQGGTLAERAAKQPLSVAEAVQTVAILARAVHHAHERGIIHRDLKPSNILLNHEGTPLIADFGLARQVKEDAALTTPGAVLGTACYMAYEQAAGLTDQIGPPTDIYALGAILFELLVGRPPFLAETRQLTIARVLTEPAPALRSVRPDLPPALERICERCLRKKASERYLTAKDLADELGRAAAGLGDCRRPRSFSRVWLTAAAAVGLVILAALPVLWNAWTARPAVPTPLLAGDIGTAAPSPTPGAADPAPPTPMAAPTPAVQEPPRVAPNWQRPATPRLPHRADLHLEEKLLTAAEKLLDELRSQKLSGVGVLPFAVEASGGGPTPGPLLSRSLAGRLLIALVMANDPDKPVMVVNDASEVAARLQRDGLSAERFHQLLFLESYQPAWGKKPVQAGALLSGQARINWDTRTLLVGITLLDRQNQAPRRLASFQVDLDDQLILEAGGSFGFPLLDNQGPVGLKIWCNGQSLPLTLQNGILSVPEPKAGDRIEFELYRTWPADREPYGVVLKVNGASTLGKCRFPTRLCAKYLLTDDKGRGFITGFRLNQRTEAFKVLPDAESQALSRAGGTPGEIQIAVFRYQSFQPEPVEPIAIGDEAIRRLSLQAMSCLGLESPETDENLTELQCRYRASVESLQSGNNTRGAIGSESAELPTAIPGRSESYFATVPCMAATIRYFQPREK